MFRVLRKYCLPAECNGTTVALRQLANNIYALQQRQTHKYSVDPDVEAATRQFVEVPVERIRNFSIIAHVDHGKSTLADRLLELTGSIESNTGQNQVLDSLQVERERGITVKAQTASILYKHKGATYLLNLIDTPGHVDFSNEVSRSVAICDGVVLLVDACQSVQAQTVANYHLAQARQLPVVPVLNKIDMRQADPARVCRDMEALFGIDPTTVLQISAKVGTGVSAVLERVIECIPPPSVDRNAAFRALVFDIWFERQRGALKLIYVLNGQLEVGKEIQSLATKKVFPVKTLAVLRPEETNVQCLAAGQIGLISCNIRKSKEAVLGDTVHLRNKPCEAVGAYKPAKPVVFAGVFPADKSKNVELRTAIDKLVLNDSAVTVQIDSTVALGQGFRLGFLGLLHMEVFCQRLEQEFGAEPIITAPSVTYRLKLKHPKLIKQYGRQTIELSNAALFPAANDIEEYHEPMIIATIITPEEHIGAILSLCAERRGLQQSSANIDGERVMMTYLMPLAEVILDFNDQLKSLSSGYASFSYEDRGYQLTHVVKLEVHLNGNPIEEFSRIVHHSKASIVARQLALKLVDQIPRQMVQIAVQVCVGSKVLARETIKAYRKDVTTKLHGGGDITRRMKLIRAQNEGKKKMRMFANVRVPHETFINVLKR